MSEHKIVHVEISAMDTKEAGEFYEKLFGWKTNYIEEMDYMMYDDGGVGGALSKVADDNPAGTVLIYVGTNDVEASLKKAEELGAKVIVPKMEIPGYGWMGVFKDPTGNMIGLYKGGGVD